MGNEDSIPTKVIALTQFINDIQCKIHAEDSALSEKGIRKRARAEFHDLMKESFFIAKNQDVINFLLNDAVNQGRYHRNKTYLVIRDSKEEFAVFFVPKNVPKNVPKKFK